MDYINILNGHPCIESTIAEVSEAVDQLALESILNEVISAPKPGLVDSRNSGAHTDMDIDTFMASAKALRGYFGACFVAGHSLQQQAVQEILNCLQILGQRAETEMLAATNGVNTHKGIIFSLGILSGAMGLLYGKEELKEESIREMASNLCRGLCERAFAEVRNKPVNLLTKGERMYLAFGMKGARGEAESGFATVANISLPTYTQLMEQCVSPNDALVETLLHLIAYTMDTNIVSRLDRRAAAYGRRSAQRCLEQGGYLGAGGFQRVVRLDQSFIKHNISPGGSADLLAVTYFLYHLQFKHLSQPDKQGGAIR